MQAPEIYSAIFAEGLIHETASFFKEFAAAKGLHRSIWQRHVCILKPF